MTQHRFQLREDDCFRTCLAMLLDLEPAQVPNFYGEASSDDPEADLIETIEKWIDGWLAQNGHQRLRCYFPQETAANLNELAALVAKCNPELSCIVSGELVQAGHGHSIVMDFKEQKFLNPSPMDDIMAPAALGEIRVWLVEWIVRAPHMSNEQKLAIKADEGWA